MNLVRENIKDEYKILELQNKILEIMEDVSIVCKKNNINYFICGGTALGAIRHEGFIPWDDDIDIHMLPNDYKKFKKIFFSSETMKKKYYLQEYGLPQKNMITMSKIRMNNTTYIEKTFEDKDMHQGIYIDILPIFYVEKSKIIQIFKLLIGQYITLKSLADRGGKKKGFYGIFLKVMTFLPNKFMFNFFLKRLYLGNNSPKENIGYFFEKRNLKKAIYRKEILFPLKDIQFEKVKLKAPNNLESYLKQEFGDYMKIPEKKDRKQHAFLWDISSDFTKYNKKINNFGYEKIL